MQREVPEGFVEDVRKCYADQVVDQWLDEWETWLPHGVDHEVGDGFWKEGKDVEKFKIHLQLKSGIRDPK